MNLDSNSALDLVLDCVKLYAGTGSLLNEISIFVGSFSRSLFCIQAAVVHHSLHIICSLRPELDYTTVIVLMQGGWYVEQCCRDNRNVYSGRSSVVFFLLFKVSPRLFISFQTQ